MVRLTERNSDFIRDTMEVIGVVLIRSGVQRGQIRI